MSIQQIAVVGAGAMGRGIAQIAVLAGTRVKLYDVQQNAAQQACDSVYTQLEKLLQKNRITPAQLEFAREHLQAVDHLQDLQNCELVVEAIVEKLDIKQALFRQLEDIVSVECILASNTSSLSVTAIAAACKHPQRVAGLHFFNPVPLMKVAEVIRALLTDERVCQSLYAFVERTGHKAVHTQDTPGFIVNHAGRAYLTEALRIVQEGVADFATIDMILRDAAGFRLGPFELLDLTGLDVSHPVMESIYHQYYQEPRYRPSVITAQRLHGGVLGRKSGRGFYAYDGAAAPAQTQVRIQNEAWTGTVWVSHAELPIANQLRHLLEQCGATVEYGVRPSNTAICLVYPFGEDVTTCVVREQLDATRSFGIDALFDFQGHLSLMRNPASDPSLGLALLALMQRSGLPASLIDDSNGFVLQRVLASIVNIACDMVQQKICTPDDLDSAVKLGLAYPHGPLEWGQKLGASRILAILQNMRESSGDPRYRPSPWLMRRAQLGLPLTFSRP